MTLTQAASPETMTYRDADRKIVRQPGRAWSLPTFSVFSADGNRLIASGFRSLKEAIADDLR